MWRIPSKKELRAIRDNLRYDPRTGHLWWTKPGPKRRLSLPAGRTNKNDYIDAEACAEAVTRPTMRFVPIKTDDQLDLQSLHKCASGGLCAAPR